MSSKNKQKKMINVVIEKSFDNGAFKSGEVQHLHMGFQDTCVTISNAKTDEKLGEVIGCLGGGVEIHNETTKDIWFLSAKELWIGFSKVIKANKKGDQQIPLFTEDITLK